MGRGKTPRKGGHSSKGANQKVSDEFLASNGRKSGIITTDSGKDKR